MPTCGNCSTIYGKAKHDKCPKCGSNRVMVFKNLHKECPECGTINNFSATKCSNCDALL